MNVNLTIHVHCKDVKSKFIKLMIGHSTFHFSKNWDVTSACELSFIFQNHCIINANISTCSKLPVYTDSKFINQWSHGHNWGPKVGAKFKDQST